MVSVSLRRVKGPDWNKLGEQLNSGSKEFWRDVGAVTIMSIIDNIERQRQASGSALKRNAPSTLERKRKQGRGQRALVDAKHRFVQRGQGSWKIAKYLPRGSGIIIDAATAELRELVGHVRETGYTGWEGLSKDAWGAVLAAMREEIKRALRRAGGRR
ncbi:MAG TPA: hypothetical protein VJ787_13035 [Thermoleophilia bacterium]|nr:hypothetical protein [Thermoleophilia bacterium]